MINIKKLEGNHSIPFKGNITVTYNKIAENYSFSGKTKKGECWSGVNVSEERIKKILTND